MPSCLLTPTLVLMLALLSGACNPSGEVSELPANPAVDNAETRAPRSTNLIPSRPTASIQALLQRLHDVTASQPLLGQHNFPDSLSIHSDTVRAMTGREPDMWGSDLTTLQGETRPAVVAEAIRQHQAGRIITLMWHSGRPTDRFQYNLELDVKGSLYEQQWDELLTPGTNEHGAWTEKVDNLAVYLRQLQRAGVPVLWRPYHEMNGNWFWWGGEPARKRFTRLWIMLHDRLVREHGLDNLVWVWSPHMPLKGDPKVDDVAFPMEEFYPGAAYVDALALDVYDGAFRQNDYATLLRLAEGKPVGLGEVGKVPTPQQLAEQPRWSWIMLWPDELLTDNTAQELRQLYRVK